MNTAENRLSCETVADRLPDWAAGRLSASEMDRVGAHLDTCADCAASARVLRAVFASRAAPPAGFAERMQKALAEQPGAAPVRAPRRWTPAWAVSAAAVLVLAAGSLLMQRRGAPQIAQSSEDSAVVASLGDVPEENPVVWIEDDGAVAGAPVLDDLSDDALVTLAEEIGA